MRMDNFCRGHDLGIAVEIIVLTILLLVGGAGAVTEIDSCTAISEPGTYVLNTSILDSIVSSCINIVSNDVVFDGAGYTIDGVDAWNYGVYVYNSTMALTNVTIKNLIVIDWGSGIYYKNAAGGSIANNIANSNRNSGIELFDSSNHILTNNTANSNRYGISLAFTSYYNTLTNNTAKENSEYDIYPSLSTCNNNMENNVGSGDRLIKYFNNSVNLQNENLSELILCNSDNSNVKNVTIEGSATIYNNGLLIISTDNSNFTNIKSLKNFRGILLYYSTGNYLTNIIANSNLMGIQFDNSNSNYLINNNAESNDYGFSLFNSSINTLTNNNVNNSQSVGLFLASSISNFLTNNIASNNPYGMFLTLSSNNTIYNNYLNNTNNAKDDGNNIWNLTKTEGTNIVSGSYLGGNFWANPSGTGFSQTCSDDDIDGICDSPFMLNSDNTDYFPLAYNISIPSPPGIINGSVAYGPMIWNASNFPAFVVEETLEVIDLFFMNRTIPRNGMIYSTSAEPRMLKVVSSGLDMNASSWDYGIASSKGLEQAGPGQAIGGGNYYVVGWQGQKYVALNGKVDKLTRLVLEQNTEDTKNLTAGETWNIGDGWMLTLNSTDTKALPLQAAFTLSKDGIIKDFKVVSVGTPDAKPIYTYVEKNISGENNVPLFVTYAANITKDKVQLKYTWAISTSVTLITSGDIYGVFKNAAVYGKTIELMNSDESIFLSRDSTILLMDSLYLVVINSPSLAYYPMMTTPTPAPPSSLSITINNGDVYANSTSVALRVSAENAEEMSFSNDSISWSPWEPFASMKSWTLTSGDSLKTMYFKARNGAGEAVPVNNTIILDTTPPSVVITSPANGIFVNTTNIIVMGTATDNSGIKGGCFVHISEYFANGGCGGGMNNLTSIPFTYNVPLAEGWNFIKITYIDVADNYGSASINVTLSEPSKVRSVVTNTTAFITWVTNNSSDSMVKYGLSPGNYAFIKHINESAIFHNVILTNLSPDTNYYFVANSTDMTGSTQSQEITFWTPYDNFQGNLNITNIEIRQLTDHGERASSPVWGEDKIFYASNISGDMDVWVMDKDGSNKTRITNSTADEYPSDSWVTLENNSKAYKVLYVSRTNGSSSIWVTNGTNKVQLIDDSYENLDPVLIFVPAPVVFGMLPSGTINDNVPLINASYYSYYGNISKVNISVDGIDVTPFANISLSNLNHTPAEPLKMGYHNFTIKVETDKYTKGFGHQFFNIRYIYNPSPSCTVFTNNPTIRANISVGYGNISSVIMILDGINVTSNATIYPSYIEYTPIAPLNNGSHSVSLEVKSTRNISDNENWAFSVNLPMPCTPPSGRSGGGGGGYSKILFASNRSGNFDLWMMNLDGSGQEQITYDPSNESSPAWVGSKVVFVSDKSGSKDIWSMDINGSNKKQLTSSVLDENMPSWSYIGGILYTAGKDGVFNLEAMNTNGTGKINITNSSASVIDPAHSSVKAGFLNSPWNMGILYSSATKGESSIYLMNFEEIGPKVKFWKLGEGYSLQVAGIDTGASPSQAWFKFQRNGTTRDDRVVRVGEAFSLFDNQRVILNAVLDRIGSSDLDYYFEVELVNVTQYSSIDGSPLFANATKILVSKIILNELLVSFPGIDMPPSSGGGGPSGGGGGGGASGENYSNIVLREKYEEAIYKDKTTSYRFKNASNPLMFVNITGNVNAGLVTAMAEILKGTSTLVKEAAPGIVYKNINLWVGTSGFATSKNIKGATIMFRVEDSWIDSNNFERIEIKLVKWEGGKWITLETSEKRRDGTFIYFEAKTTGFSPFAITGIRSIPSAAPPQITTPSPTGIPVTTAAQAPAMNLALIAGVIILITIVVVMYLWRRK